MSNLGWIKLHRKLREWEWYSDTNCVRVFLELLLTCEYTDKKWRGIIVKRGQLLTSLKELSSITNLTEKQIRTVLDKLKKTGEIRSTRADQGQLVTLTHYEEYQDERLERAGERADRGQTEGRPRAGHIDKELKETKNIRSKEEDLSLPSHCETEKPKRKKSLPVVADPVWLSEFENFWIEYGKIGGRQPALKAYLKTKQEGISYGIIIAGLRQYQSQCNALGRGQQYIKHASTWLNARGWEDEYTIQQASSDARSAKQRQLDAASLRGLQAALSCDW